jgi:formate hydrogenlyase transcriptional activator
VDLEKAIRERRFREDLYYRLSVFPVKLPPLRERKEDLKHLTVVLLEEQARRTGLRGRHVTPEGLARLASYDWPGNIRELANVLERATILSPKRELGPAVLDLPSRAAVDRGHVSPRVTGSAVRVGTLDEVQRAHIERVLALTDGRLYGKGGAAERLGLKPSTLQSRMKKLGVHRLA